MILVMGYHEYHGGGGGGGRCSVLWRDIIFCYLSISTVLNTPYGTRVIPHMYHEIPHSTQIT